MKQPVCTFASKKRVTMYRTVLSLFLVFHLVTAHAVEGTLPLTLAEAEARFLSHNLSLIAERYNIDMAQAQVVQAKLFENPVISLEQNVYNRLNGRYFDVGAEGEAIVEVEQLIYIAGQRNKRVRLEKINTEIAGYQFNEVMRTLGSDLKEKFIELYYTRKALTVYEREISYLTRLLDVYRQQSELGNISMLERSRLQALLLSLQQERNEADNKALSLAADLRILVGLDGGMMPEPVFDEGALDKIDLEAIPFASLSQRLADRPDLRMAGASIQASEAGVKLQKSLAFPEVSLKGVYDRAGSFINNYFAVGMSVSVPVFNRNQGNIKAARLAVLQNGNREMLARQQADNELFTAYARLDKALQLYRSSNKELEQNFNCIIEGVNDNFQKRNISLLEFIDYYETYKETCLQLYDIRKQVVLAAEGLNTVVGTNVIK